MNTKENLKKIYNALLRLTITYYSYHSCMETCYTKEELEHLKMKYEKDLRLQFHFFPFYFEDCLDLSYQDQLKILKK